MRVVGGIATHSEGATIRTPVAAIGLRGGIAIISHSGAKGTQAILGFGHMSVTSLCAGSNCTPTTTEVSRPGFGVTVAGLSRPPSSPGRASSQEIAQSNAPLTSQKGQKGGASQQPTDSLAQSYNVGHAEFARRADRSDRLSGSRQCAYDRERHATDCPARGAEQRLDRDHADASSRFRTLIKALTPVKPPPRHRANHAGHPSHTNHTHNSDYAGRACSNHNLRHGHQRAFQHQRGLDREPRALSHRRLRRERQFHGLADPWLSGRRPQFGRHAEYDLKTVPGWP